jgi:HPt (histidine-containing phosphotransfer) domain-containing protein
MDELQRMYRQALPDRIAALSAAREDGSAEAVSAIRRIAHTLRGSGGTYGFPEISDAARAVEDAGAPDLDARLDELIAVLQEAAEGLHS